MSTSPDHSHERNVHDTLSALMADAPTDLDWEDEEDDDMEYEDMTEVGEGEYDGSEIEIEFQGSPPSLFSLIVSTIPFAMTPASDSVDMPTAGPTGSPQSSPARSPTRSLTNLRALRRAHCLA
ncbi:hypothetical protein K461DRAFT_176900 [Myriangium duriaei CBS 260.36]|uniref:Uncharacterized protein n=1 Tax=Myriangium duriaei CBS 260.36 TaxID=1168546 RepID=A0A9P4MEY6_9PEZI|nr:hypothetical protein K461DRAFT_176900 [Myriangium duriaei CBS 260.36]